MDIPIYKNPWYYGALGVSLFILYLAWISTAQLSIIIAAPDGTPSLNIELAYRALFNPLWAMVLYLVDRGMKKNSEHHSKILQNLQGVVFSAIQDGRTSILTNTLANLIYKQGDVAAEIERHLEAGDTVTGARTDPIA